MRKIVVLLAICGACSGCVTPHIAPVPHSYMLYEHQTCPTLKNEQRVAEGRLRAAEKEYVDHFLAKARLAFEPVLLPIANWLFPIKPLEDQIGIEKGKVRALVEAQQRYCNPV